MIIQLSFQETYQNVMNMGIIREDTTMNVSMLEIYERRTCFRIDGKIKRII